MPPYGIAQFYDQVYNDDPFNINRRDSEIIIGADGKAKTIPILPMTSDEIMAGSLVPPDFDAERFQSIFPTSGIASQAPLENLGFDTSFGVANEPDVEQEFLPGQKKSGGIADLFRAALGFVVPGASLLMGGGSRALEGIRSLNQRLRNTDFGRSRTLQEYFQKREARKEAERLAPIERQLREASERGGGYQPTTRSQNVARTASRVSGGKTRAYGL